MQGIGQKKDNRHIIQRLMVALIGAALLIAIIALLFSGGSGRALSVSRLPCYGSQSPIPFGEAVVFFDGGILTCCDTKGNVRWRFTLGDNANFDTGDGYIVAWSGAQVFIINENGVSTYNEHLDSAVQFARAGSQYVAFVIGDQNACTLVVKTMRGDTVSQETNDFNSLIILDVGFFRNQGEYMWVLSLDAYGVVCDTILNVYNVGNSLVADVSLGDSLQYAVLFSNKRLYVIGTETLRAFDYRGTEYSAASAVTYGWQLVGRHRADSAQPTMLFAPVEQASGAMISELRLITGEKDTRITLPDMCVGTATDGRNVYAIAGAALYCTGDDGVTFTSTALNLNANIDSLTGVTAGGTAIVTCADDSVYAITLPTR